MTVRVFIPPEYEYSQAKEIEKIGDPVVKNGICLMLVINWLIRTDQIGSVKEGFHTICNDIFSNR